MSENIDEWRKFYREWSNKLATEKLVVCVHPTYGRDLVTLEKHNEYLDNLQDYWMTVSTSALRVLLSSGDKDEILLRYLIEPDFVLYTFPRLVNDTGIRSDHIEVCGSTARRQEHLPEGCADRVVNLLKKNDYGENVSLVAVASLITDYIE